MEIIFKDNKLEPLNFNDEDYQKFDGVLALILSRLTRLCFDSETIIVNYPTTIEEFALYAIAKQFCVLTRKELILKDNQLFRLNPLVPYIKEKRKLFLSDLECQTAAYIDAFTLHKRTKSLIKPWNRVEMPLIRHDYTTIMLIALHYGYPIEKITEVEYKDLHRFYINQKVMHWDDL